MTIEKLEKQCLACRRCSLRDGCIQVIFGAGSRKARIMLVGEAPGASEDQQGIPFVGSAGQLLTRILAAVNINREEVYITNIVKCRPPRNRMPEPEEISSCLAYLHQQIALINPRIIVCLGSLSTRTLIDEKALITRMRGQWKKIGSRMYMPTFHPAALLRDPRKKRPVWEDFKQVEKKYREILDQGG
ncbi:MAG: uracil-DNA glycosylase [Firmicutes bacterium]|nr:uracil-DNA glycosylase [Bacillota bacterium]